jgi:hypothetical protein
MMNRTKRMPNTMATTPTTPKNTRIKRINQPNPLEDEEFVVGLDAGDAATGGWLFG